MTGSGQGTSHVAQQQRLNMGALYWRVLDAIKELGPSSAEQVHAWLEKHHPAAAKTRANDRLCLLTVNDANRRHHNHSRREFRSDQDHPQDVLFRREDGIYELYDIQRHGVWDLQPNGKSYVAVKVGLHPLRAAMEAARAAVESEAKPLTGEEDARQRVMRAMALREGQQGFRALLLEAYEGRCAVTACSVPELLEAAHIVPYRGPDTNRVDNGLLLRTDIHTLFDRGLVWVDADGMIDIAERLRGSEYERLAGKRLGLPRDSAHRPHPDHLAIHRRVALG